MKILMTTSFYPPYHIGGDAVHVKYLAEALAKKGHEVHVLHSMDAYNLKKNEKKTPKKSRVIVHTLKSPLGKLEPILNYCIGTQTNTLNSFKKLVEKENFDVVHHHNISLLGHNILKKIKPYTNLYTAHDYWLICQTNGLMKGGNICKKRTCFSCSIKNKKAYQFFRNSARFKKYLGDIDAVIAPSQFMGNILKKEFKDTKVIYNFIPKTYAKNKKTEDYFIYAGVLEEHKGVLNLIKVFSQIDKRLLIAGAGRLEKDIKKLKISNIELLGWKKQKELFKLINNAQALIIPSAWPENNPLIALESLSMGTPVIGSDMGGIPEIVGKVDKKLIFHNLEELKKILLNFNKNKYPSNKIRKIYQKNFSQKTFFKKYNKLIKK